VITLRDWLNDLDPDILVLDGCDDAILGVVQRCGQPPIVIYDFDELVVAFIDHGMTYTEAVEHIGTNIEGAWLGPSTPGVLYRPEGVDP